MLIFVWEFKFKKKKKKAKHSRNPREHLCCYRKLASNNKHVNQYQMKLFLILAPRHFFGARQLLSLELSPLPFRKACAAKSLLKESHLLGSKLLQVCTQNHLQGFLKHEFTSSLFTSETSSVS